MSLSATYRQNTPRIPRAIRQRADRKVAEDSLRLIRRQVAQERDRHGRRLARYNDHYARRKGSRRVDLKQSNKMLRRMKVVPARATKAGRVASSIVFGTPRDEAVAMRHIKGTKNADGSRRMPQRDFFGLTARNRRRASRAFSRASVRRRVGGQNQAVRIRAQIG